jgi:hypothetical protein
MIRTVALAAFLALAGLAAVTATIAPAHAYPNGPVFGYDDE